MHRFVRGGKTCINIHRRPASKYGTVGWQQNIIKSIVDAGLDMYKTLKVSMSPNANDMALITSNRCSTNCIQTFIVHGITIPHGYSHFVVLQCLLNYIVNSASSVCA